MDTSRKYLEKITQSCLNFLLPLSEEKLYKTIVEEAKKLVKADAGSVYIKKGETLEKVYATHKALYIIQSRPRGYVRKVFESGYPLIHTNKTPENIHPEFKKLNYLSFILVPLSYGGDGMGVLCLHSTRLKQFNHEDARILTYFCSLAFLSIRKTQLYKETLQALETRDLFIAMASHELKTPLTSIHLYVDMLQKKMAQSNDKKILDSLSRELFRLTTCIKDLLQVDLIKRGKFPYILKEFYIEDVIKQGVTTFRLTHPMRTVFYKNKIKGNIKIRGDYNKLLQVISNLLHNAAKYSPSQSPITLLLENNRSSISFTVEDAGKGIPKNDLSKIFDQYYKAKNSISEGMGLGLYIIKNIIDQHQGKISINSHLNKGTRVTIELPKVTV